MMSDSHQALDECTDGGGFNKYLQHFKRKTKDTLLLLSSFLFFGAKQRNIKDPDTGCFIL